KTLLPMPLYEMGICLRHGWGVPPSYPASTYFFGLAARLGDVDAQVEYAYCLKKGIGIEKSKMEAAKWFRKAHDQGASIFGESWIHKQKW
ncbi:uncharacterized protein BJ171DRAFT_405119, partial [Polychytrium aggregatum]|uniref:uncharacterized protein n=1 Tax=Polychytrium aggregatum TaxID=110093 RepID=UPI0022FDB45C